MLAVRLPCTQGIFLPPPCAMQDKELQAVLAAHWPDTGIPPARASAGFYLVVYNHYLDGEQCFARLLLLAGPACLRVSH